MARIKFMTDSAADIPAEYIEKYDIEVLQFPIIVGDREITIGVDYTIHEFYNLLLELDEIPTHAQLTPFQLEELYSKYYAEGYDALIYTCINFKGSNTGNNALLAKDNFYDAHPEAQGKFDIRVIDSKTYTYNYGYAVVETAKAAENGAMSTDMAVAKIMDWLDHSKILFATYDLKFARKSGRVSAAAAIMGSAMGIKPIMSFPDGDSKVLAKPRGDKNVVPSIVKMMKEEMEPGSPYLVIYGGLADRNQEISEACMEAIGYPPVDVFYIGGVVAVNVGPKLVGVVIRKK